MKFTLIICTYMRPEPLFKLLQSVQKQTLCPNEILIIDGSLNLETQQMIQKHTFENLKYYLVSSTERGLTRQRNFGIRKVSNSSEVLCFLDDDTILENNYFEELIKTFYENNTITGVGGVAINENNWVLMDSHKKYNKY
jgi:glycosyltransferase involved in cell wall biosynthesis